jgi:hypothetical protein
MISESLEAMAADSSSSSTLRRWSKQTCLRMSSKIAIAPARDAAYRSVCTPAEYGST